MVLAADCLCSTLDGVETDFNVALVCSPGGDADPHGCLALPLSSSAPANTFFLNSTYYGLRLLGRTERDKDLIDDYFIKDFVSDRLKIVCHSSCIATGSLYEIGQAFSS
jgi:hypothetical protein